MPQQIVIAEQLRIAALLTDERIDELIVAQGRYQIGDVYLGTVENVLPAIDAGFVKIDDSEKNGFIHVSDLGPLRNKKEAASIDELLRRDQPALVQVMKEPTATKGPRLTGNIALPGRYLVLQPHGKGVNLSSKITLEEERNRLRALGVLIKPPGAGLVIRSEANGVVDSLLIEDLEILLRKWEAIDMEKDNATPPVLLYRDEDFVHRVLRDHFGAEISKVVVDHPAAKERVSIFLKQDYPNVLVECHTEPNNLLEDFRINLTIREALNPRVDLPSGGYIIIEPTEALTVIDVNSGSFTRATKSRETVLWTNCEAAIEIARQLKLRNIGGVIIIDFIDMESKKDQLQLLKDFTAAISNDAAHPQIAQLTELGLVELTRKRQGQNIYELFGKVCTTCFGLGHVAVLPAINQLQPLASASGLVRNSTAPKADITSSLEADNAPRRRGRGRPTSELGHLSTVSSLEETALPNIDSEEDSTTSDLSNHRQEPELIAIPMNEVQEEVFSWLGLSPTLLLDPPPENENLLVRVVRPGIDAESLLEEARQSISANTNKRRRRGRANNKVFSKNEQENYSNTPEETNQELQIISSQENNLTETSDAQKDESSNLDATISEEKDPESEEPPRRKRRRSSALE